MTPKELYDRDFFEWSQSNAALLRARRLSEAENRLRTLLAHLPKRRFQPERRGRSGQATIRVQRGELLRLLRQMPSLRSYLRDTLPEICRPAAGFFPE